MIEVINLRKKILVHGTADSLQKFFSDAVSRDFDVVGILSDSPEKISVEDDGNAVEIFSPESLPKLALTLVDGIIFTAANINADAVKFFFGQGVEPRKIILWDADEGWGTLDIPPATYFCGLEFHIRTAADQNFFDYVRSWLQNQRRMKNLSPTQYPETLTKIFQNKTGRTLDFNNLRTFTEKMQWLKIFDATEIKSKLADKYAVRSWVAQKIGDEYLIPLLGIWNDFDEIDFDALPNQFVLKCNHGSGMNIVVRDKKTFDVERAREKFKAWMEIDFATGSLEMHYTRIERKIIAEKYIENMSNGVIDYKFHCFSGVPEFVQVIGDRNFAEHTRYQKFCDLNYNDIGAMFEDYPHFPYDVPKPKNFEDMKHFAKILSESFSYVRVDFYEIDDKILFGEMTFTSDSGYLPHKKTWTYEKDLSVGNLLKLPPLTTPPKI